MPLRLAGQAYMTIQGSDAQGWLREVVVQDAIPGLKINQQGTGRVFDFQDGGASKLYLPDGGDVTMVGSLVFDLANDVTITPTNPAAPRTLTIPDPGANDTFAFLAATQTLTSKTLTSPTIQGTVGAGTGLTMPAFTAGGDITGSSGFALKTSAGHIVFDATNGIYQFGSSSPVAMDHEATTDVTTSAKIIKPDTRGGGGLLLIFGDDGSNNRFMDTVFASRDSNPTVHANFTVKGSPQVRTYTRVNNDLLLQMAANTYQIRLFEFRGA